MSTERETPDSESAEVRGEKPRARESNRPRKKAKRPKPPIPKNETEIDAPDRQTLAYLGVMCVVTLVLWGFARGACNYHPPRETRRPRAVKIEDLARDPKDAAIELQQRRLQRDFTGALELTTGDAKKLVEDEKAKCEAKPQDCALERGQRKKTVFTRGELLERNPGGAVARVISTTPTGTETNIVKLERAGSIWKATSSVKDDGSFKATPAATIELKPPMAAPTGSVVTGSVTAAGSAPVTLKLEAPATAKPAAPATAAPAPKPAASN